MPEQHVILNANRLDEVRVIRNPPLTPPSNAVPNVSGCPTLLTNGFDFTIGCG